MTPGGLLIVLLTLTGQKKQLIRMHDNPLVSFGQHDMATRPARGW